MLTPYDSVMMIGFGGPPRPEDAVEFVRGVVAGRPTTPERIAEVAHHYQVVGGSPFNRLTAEQAAALEAELARRGVPLPVKLGFKHWSPWIEQAVAELAAAGRARTVGVIMAAHPCYSCDDKYREAVEAARKAHPAAPGFSYTEFFGRHYGYVKAQAELIRDVLTRLTPEQLAAAEVVFTAHSVPINGCGPCTRKERSCPYSTHYGQTCRLIAEELGLTRYGIAYQSRAETRRPWLGPDVCEMIATLPTRGTKTVVVAPVGFVCDHVEVLYDLDIEARQAAETAGMGFYRVPTVQTHPRFVSLLADLVEAVVRTAEVGRPS